MNLVSTFVLTRKPSLKLFLFLLILLPLHSQAQTDLCDIIEMDSCSQVSRQFRRSSSGSLPSPSTSANLNPANVSFDRGLGLEMIIQSHNPVNFNFVTGSGKLGGALISQSLENSFFGNRTIEIADVYLDRFKERRQYRPEKLTAALGGKLFRRKHFTLDAGILLKKHDEINKVNPGVGLSGRIGPLHIGASVYNDDAYLELKDYIDPVTGLPYTTVYGSETYTERFTVQTYSVGTRIGKLTLDGGVISTSYKFYDDQSSRIYLYSGSYSYEKYLFNLAVRNEKGPAYKIEDNLLVEKDVQSEVFWSVQRSFGKHFIFGLNYNLYLLRETSVSATIFF